MSRLRLLALPSARWRHQRGCKKRAAMVVALLAAAPSLAFGEEAGTSSMQKEVDELRKEAQSLKQEVKSLQETTPARPTTPSPVKQREPVARPQAQPAPNAAQVESVAAK